MEMVDAAQRAMQSPDPQVRKMAEETMRSSNAQITTLMEMRRRFFENPDKGSILNLDRHFIAPLLMVMLFLRLRVRVTAITTQQRWV
jgi:hypothetical protein